MNLQIPTRWIEPPTDPLPESLRSRADLPDLVLAILFHRGLRDPDQIQRFLDPGGYSFANPYDLPGLDKAVAVLKGALRADKCIGVWGDFDVDGQTATALLVQTLRWLGARVEYVIPVRQTDSHGVHLPGLQKFLSRGVELVLTCDTGIGALDAAAAMRDAGVPYVVTDHHQLPEALPRADALVNPQFLPTGHPLRSLCGVGTAYQLALALLSEFGKQDRADDLLDLVALGTIADVAELSGDNRALVQLGLQRMRGQLRPAFQALLEQAGVSPASPLDEVIGFTIAPRLNAVGRLGDSNPMVEFLLEPDIYNARTTAARLEGLNAHRKMLVDQVFQAALAALEREPERAIRPVVILSHPGWPGGVVGIVASRLAEILHRPVILLNAPPDQPARGSARSIDGVDITAAIAENSSLLIGFGGHPMAAGLSLLPENLPAFERALAKSIERQVGGILPEKTLTVDAYLTLDQINFDLVAAIERLSPFGAGNPAFIFAARNLTLNALRPLGRSGEHQLAQVTDEEGSTRELLWWNSVGLARPQGKFDLAFSLRASVYRGAHQIQLEWVDARPLEVEERVPSVSTSPLLKDLRADIATELQLVELAARPDLLLWLEDGRDLPGALRRFELGPAVRLAVGCAPPALDIFRRVVQLVQPKEIWLYNLPVPWLDPPAVMNRLAGLAKFILNQRSGLASLAELAAACAQTEQTVVEGLYWLQANGSLQVYLRDTGEVLLASAAGSDEGKKKLAWGRFSRLVAETNAFRLYYARADLAAISAALSENK